jgi:serine/threonine-protein kinase
MSDPTEQSGRLSSWKEIAAHLGVSVRTAQRWEATESLPVHRHKHFAQSSVFAYRLELDRWWESRPHLQEPSPAQPSASIAVLPFVNLNRDQENEIFSDGLTEELINALAQVQGLHVVSRTSTFYFKGKTGDVRAIGLRLGVRSVLEGSVRRADDRLRITAQLISTGDGCQLWSQRYDRPVRDVFQLQEDIARSIVDALCVRLTGGRITRQYGSDSETFALYLEGRHQWNKRTRTGILNAIECFQRVLANDGGMASAWAGLADCYAMLPAYGEMQAGEALIQARAAARKALEIDDSLAEAHAALAFTAATYEFDWTGAEARFRRALELNPNYSYARLLYAAVTLAPTGRLDEACVQQRRACELDPLSAVPTAAMGTCLVMMRQFDEAISACRRALALDPEYPWAHRFLGEAYLLKGMYREAEAAFSKIEAPVFATGFLGYCYARTGREPLARGLLSQLEGMSGACPTLALQVAVLYLGLGDLDLAFAWLDKALEARAPGVHWLNIEPIWDPLRSDARFSELLRRLRLTGRRSP